MKIFMGIKITQKICNKKRLRNKPQLSNHDELIQLLIHLQYHLHLFWLSTVGSSYHLIERLMLTATLKSTMIIM